MTIYKSFDDFNNIDQVSFLKNGYIIKKIENIDGFNTIKSSIKKIIESKYKNKLKNLNIFDDFHKILKKDKINPIRMNIYNSLNKKDWFKPTFFSLAKNTIENIVSNELAMQSKINFSIMMPEDKSSNIPIHLDPHSGESPYQCVLWIPLTDVDKSKSIFILPKKKNIKAQKNFTNWMKKGGRNEVFKNVKNDIKWLKIQNGEFLIFSPNMIHGSVNNTTNETRFSFNVRFKSLFSPYTSSEKGLGNFYTPIKVLPATNFGLDYLKIKKNFEK